MAQVLRKRRTRQHIIADLSVNHVEHQALLCGFSVERLIHDYGIDLEVFTFNRKGEIEEGKILLQIKASDQLAVRPAKTTFAFRIERKDLVLWLAQPMPVILVVYEAPKDIAYWLYIQSYFSKRKDFNLFAAGKKITLHIPIKNVVHPTAMRRFAGFRDRVLKQLRGLIYEED
jgi:uncharacterized protein DUF4365